MPFDTVRARPGAPAGAPPASGVQAELGDVLRANADEIVTHWSRLLMSGGFGDYADRPLDEIESTCRQCFDGYVQGIAQGDHARTRRFVHRETRTRIGQGFRASEIGHLLAAFRAAAWPLLTRHYAERPAAGAEAFERLQHCIDQAQFELADYYQLAAQQKMEEHLAEMEAMNRRLEELSVRDGLTGLYNRRYFNDRLSHEVHRVRRHSRPLSFLMVDVDHFKHVNDTYGHQAGDEVLRGVALVIVNQTRTLDIAARYGGEEFGVLLPETDAPGAMVVAQRLREAIALVPHHRKVVDELGPEPEPIYCTISVGVTTFDPSATPDAAQVVRAADAAVYEAKRAGRNRVVASWDLAAPVADTAGA